MGFARRFFVACFTSIQFVGHGYSNFIFLVILLIFFWLQIYYQPFAHTRVNKMESLMLLLLIAAFAAANFIRIDDNDRFVGFMLSLCILIPLLIVIFYGVKLIIHRVQWSRYDADDQRISVQKSLKRAPVSLRNLEMTLKTNEYGGEEDEGV